MSMIPEGDKKGIMKQLQEQAMMMQKQQSAPAGAAQ
jgi:hypothetical protein